MLKTPKQLSVVVICENNYEICCCGISAPRGPCNLNYELVLLCRLGTYGRIIRGHARGVASSNGEVCVFFSHSSYFYPSHPAHPVSVPTLHPRDTSSVITKKTRHRDLFNAGRSKQTMQGHAISYWTFKIYPWYTWDVYVYTTTKNCKQKCVQQVEKKEGKTYTAVRVLRIYLLVEMKQVADCFDEFKEWLSQLLGYFGCGIYVIYVRIVKNYRSGVEKIRENRNSKGGARSLYRYIYLKEKEKKTYTAVYDDHLFLHAASSTGK